MYYIDDKRKANVTVLATRGLNCNLVGKKFTFSHGGVPESRHYEMTAAPSWVEETLVKYVTSLEKVSGIDTVELKNPNGDESMTVLCERYIDMTTADIIDHFAKLTPDKEAVVDAMGKVRYTYARLKRTCGALARSLIDMGVERGKNVAVIMTNSPEQIIAKFGIFKTGAVVVNISVYEKREMLFMLLSRSDISTIIMKEGAKGTETIDTLYEICPELMTCEPGKLESKRLPALKRVIIADASKEYPGTLSFDSVIERGYDIPKDAQRERAAVISHSDVATIIHTSGSTGAPKGVMQTHSAILENANSHVLALNMTGDDRLCMPVPMFHAFGCIGCALTTFMAGGTLVCIDKAEPQKLLEVLKRERCSALCGVPTLFIRLINQVRDDNMDLSQFCLEKCIAAGAPCPEKMLSDMMEVFGVRDVVVMYGMTEAGPGISSTHGNDSVEVKTKTVGHLWPGLELKFIGLDTGEEVARGEQGEICVRGCTVMKGYYNSPEETAKSIDRDGWLHTGDVGRLRDDGNITIEGRSKDIIIKNGENISPQEIESFLMRNDAIEQVCVVGAPSYKCGEIIVAFIKLKAGKELGKSEVCSFCEGRIATIKIPNIVEYVDEFPMNATGKVLKDELRKQAKKLAGVCK